jgi:hypothetical protein
MSAPAVVIGEQNVADLREQIGASVDHPRRRP